MKKIGFVGSLVALAVLVIFAGAGGLLYLKYFAPQPAPEQQEETASAPALQPLTPGVITNPKTGAQQFTRDCNGAFAEAVNIGVLPNFATLSASPPRPGTNNESLCVADTANAHYDVAYFASCAGGGDACPVLARITQDNRYVLFHRD